MIYICNNGWDPVLSLHPKDAQYIKRTEYFIMLSWCFLSNRIMIVCCNAFGTMKWGKAMKLLHLCLVKYTWSLVLLWTKEHPNIILERSKTISTLWKNPAETGFFYLTDFVYILSSFKLEMSEIRLAPSALREAHFSM